MIMVYGADEIFTSSVDEVYDATSENILYETLRLSIRLITTHIRLFWGDGHKRKYKICSKRSWLFKNQNNNNKQIFLYTLGVRSQ